MHLRTFDHFQLKQRGFTALVRAAQGGHADCVRVLLEARADMHVKDNVCVLT
jgi:hypothetical protein